MPSCTVTLKQDRPKPGYLCVPNTLADHLKKRILDLGITQKNAARHIGLGATSVAKWLKGRTSPDVRHWPVVIQFLGYDPRPAAETLGQALIRWRQGRGQSQEELAAQLRIDPGTLARWERGKRAPAPDYLTHVNTLLRQNPDS